MAWPYRRDRPLRGILLGLDPIGAVVGHGHVGSVVTDRRMTLLASTGTPASASWRSVR